MKIRVSSFNMHHGKVDLVPYTHQAMVASVGDLDSDIVCLQECDVYALRTRFAHQPRLIASKLNYHVASGFIRFFKAGFQHNAILSRYPIVNRENILLPHEKGQQKRKAIIAEIQTGNGILKVANTHLHARKNILKHNDVAIKQLEFLMEYCKEKNVDVLAGDFNLLDKDVTPIAERYGYSVPVGFPTSPAKNPKFQIDYISVRDLEIGNVQVSNLLSSDHRAISAEIELIS